MTVREGLRDGFFFSGWLLSSTRAVGIMVGERLIMRVLLILKIHKTVA